MMLQKVYIDRGLTTVYSISHPYVGTSTSDLWAGKVVTLMQRYRAEAPPPQPTATPIPTVAPDTARQGTQPSAGAAARAGQEHLLSTCGSSSQLDCAPGFE